MNSGKQQGFTLFELIIVLIVTGIVSAFAMSRLDVSLFEESGFFQQAMASIRYAQKLAISSGCTVQVDINSTSCTLQWSGCTTGNIPNPATGNNNFCLDSSPTGFPSASFSFDNIGRPGAAQTIAIGSRTIFVENETGFVHE